MSAPTNASSRKRPRHFQQGPDEAEEQQREATIAAAQPPSARLYKHTLESIFEFLDLKNLNSVLQVSRLWSSAADSMESIEHAMVKLPDDYPLFELCASRLARHISELGSKHEPMELNQEQLYLLRLRLTGLHTLHFTLPWSLKGPLIFPPSLTWLTVALSQLIGEETDLVLKAVSRISQLSVLLIQSDELMDLAPLRHATQLRTLKLDLAQSSSLSQRQANQLRDIPNLTDLDLEMDSHDLRLLLRAPHQLQLKTVVFPGALDGEFVRLLATLSKLTHLNLVHAPNIRLLSSLRNLRTLTLSSFATALVEFPTPEQVIAGVGQCNTITHLAVWNCAFTSAHVGALLSRMPAVKKLQLDAVPNLTSLSFLSSHPLARTLVSLELRFCRHPDLRAVELHHLYSLQRLVDLTIENCFGERLDSLTLKALTPPSMRLPKLVQSVIECAEQQEPQEDEP